MKRLNPKTGRPFKRWDEDERGYVFWTYQTTTIKKNGYFQENWMNPDKVDHLRPKPKSSLPIPSNPIKRLNPLTRKPYRRWDQHPDDDELVFWGYKTTESDENGYCRERWKKYSDVSDRNPFGRLPDVSNPKKRINPITGEVYQRWDEREDGMVFWRFRDKPNKTTGYLLEDWRRRDSLPYEQPTDTNPVVENPPRRINPETGDEFKRWDRDPESGMVFWNYDSSRPITDDGLCREYWRTPDNLPYPEPEEPEITFLKQCTNCQEWQVRDEDFYKRDTSYDGRESWCKSCQNQKTQKYYIENKTNHNEWSKKYYIENKDEISERFRFRYKNDPEFRQKQLVYYYIREERTRRCTPGWVSKSDFLPFYRESQRLREETGIPHHVDHIIPITHDLVCGLNCPDNLQVITAEENLQKSNKFNIDDQF